MALPGAAPRLAGAPGGFVTSAGTDLASPAVEVNLSGMFTALSTRLGTRPSLVHGARRATWAELGARTHQLAHVIAAAGLGCHHERAALAPHESGQDHLALYLHSDIAYV